MRAKDQGLKDRSTTFSEPQLRIALQGTDAGTPVVLSHALGLDLSMWDGLAAELSQEHPVLRYDHRGHGGSACPRGPYSLDDLVDDAARLIREWGRGPVVFVGLSMGGMVGQGLAIRHPELLQGLVLANTTALYPEEAKAAWAQRIVLVQQQGMAAIADMVVERYLCSDFRAAQPSAAEALREKIIGCNPSGYAACCQAVRDVDWLSRLHQIRCPTLVIAGALDVGATPAMVQAIAERIPAARLEVMAEASHLSVAESPLRFAEAVRGLLRAA
ncbi:MAG TPA: alpha/beta fold hydrolase [Methylibium sp.]